METQNYYESGLGYKIAKAESEIRESLLGGFCEVEKSIGDAECNVLSKVGDAECAIIKNDNDNAHRNTIHLNSIERDLQNQILTNRSILIKELGDKTDRVLDRVDRDTTDLKNQLRAFEIGTAEKFCEVKTEGLKNTQKILDQLAINKYDALKDELDETRAGRYYDKHGYNFALQNQEIASLKNMINSVDQKQTFASKTVQFGAGNVALPVQTANQG